LSPFAVAKPSTTEAAADAGRLQICIPDADRDRHRHPAAKGEGMIVRRASQQTERAQQLTRAMSEITTAIRLARSDQSSSPQTIKQLLDTYCAAEAELRSIIPRSIRPLS
jgi:hypothetical protein